MSQPPATVAAGPELPAEPASWVGIGAGDGETLTQFLATLSADIHASWFVLQNLGKRARTLPLEAMAQATPLPVVLAADGIAIEPGHVYVLARHGDWTVEDDHLHLRAETTDPDPYPIDRLFRMLAAVAGARALGVLLSGPAQDGSLGLDAIRGEGGITFAQDDQGARHAQMPGRAIARGSVDFVLPVQQIAGEIHELAKQVRAGQAGQDERSAFDRIFRTLRVHSGVEFNQYKATTIKRRVARRMLLHHQSSPSDYATLCETDAAEVALLYKDLLINVTRFFRDPEVFDTLKEKVFAILTRDRAPESAIRLWVPGCASGEEVYSLAIALIESAGPRLADFPIQIFGTDISHDCIEKARVGIYPPGIELDVGPERVRRFFVKVDGGFQISKSVRDLCVFARQDLTRDPPFSRLDLISCRNLMIYLGAPAQRKALSMFHYALKPGGILLLGTSETVGTATDFFALEDKRCKIYSRKMQHGTPAYDFSARGTVASVMEAPVAKRLPQDAQPGSLEAEIDRAVLAHHRSVGVVVTEDLDILHFRGQTGAFLEPMAGHARLNLQQMAREGLLLELRSAVHTARIEGRVERRPAVQMQAHGTFRPVDLEVIPLKVTDPSGRRQFLVLFEESERPVPGRSGKRKSGRSADSDAAQRLRQELMATRESLQSIIEEQEITNEELRAASEETQSSNEELQSTNEEMETAKEELQSAIEELTTVNEELHTRNEELAQANNDLVNLIASVNFPIVMLGSDMRIRRFTPMAARMLNLIPGDVGRPLSDLRSNLLVPNLEQAIWEVIETLSVQEQEVQDREGRWYSMRIRPYKTKDQRIDGVVLAFVEIDSLKRNMAELSHFKNFTAEVAEIIDEPVLVVRGDGVVLLANSAFARGRGKPASALAGESVDAVCDTWKREDLEDLLADARRHGTASLLLRPAQASGTGVRARARSVASEPEGVRAFVLAFAPVEG